MELRDTLTLLQNFKYRFYHLYSTVDVFGLRANVKVDNVLSLGL